MVIQAPLQVCYNRVFVVLLPILVHVAGCIDDSDLLQADLSSGESEMLVCVCVDQATQVVQLITCHHIIYHVA